MRTARGIARGRSKGYFVPRKGRGTLLPTYVLLRNKNQTLRRGGKLDLTGTGLDLIYNDNINHYYRISKDEEKEENRWQLYINARGGNVLFCQSYRRLASGPPLNPAYRRSAKIAILPILKDTTASHYELETLH